MMQANLKISDEQGGVVREESARLNPEISNLLKPVCRAAMHG
jgi:hypothetical protein